MGPNWKVFHHGTLCEHFQGVVIAFRSWPGVKMGLKSGEKLIKKFCPKNIQNILRVDGKWMSIKIPVHTCPKTGQKLLSSLIFYVKIRHFLLFFIIVCTKMAATKIRKQLRGVCWCQRFDTCIEEWLALVSPAQVLPVLRNDQNAPQGHKIIDWSITR